ncbi:MAG: histidine kinase, partial [bacterium]
YIGPAVWCFLHSSAEIVEGLELPEKAEAIARFKRFFCAFATMYPCPYCRHHLNRYVLRNSEVDHYPIEFLFLGQKPDNPPLQISPEERLEEIRVEKQGALRLFVWK